MRMPMQKSYKNVLIIAVNAIFIAALIMIVGVYWDSWRSSLQTAAGFATSVLILGSITMTSILYAN